MISSWFISNASRPYTHMGKQSTTSFNFNLKIFRHRGLRSQHQSLLACIFATLWRIIQRRCTRLLERRYWQLDVWSWRWEFADFPLAGAITSPFWREMVKSNWRRYATRCAKSMCKSHTEMMMKMIRTSTRNAWRSSNANTPTKKSIMRHPQSCLKKKIERLSIMIWFLKFRSLID